MPRRKWHLGMRTGCSSRGGICLMRASAPESSRLSRQCFDLGWIHFSLGHHPASAYAFNSGFGEPCGCRLRPDPAGGTEAYRRSEEHTSELQSLMRISYAVFCLKKKKYNNKSQNT